MRKEINYITVLLLVMHRSGWMGKLVSLALFLIILLCAAAGRSGSLYFRGPVYLIVLALCYCFFWNSSCWSERMVQRKLWAHRLACSLYLFKWLDAGKMGLCTNPAVRRCLALSVSITQFYHETCDEKLQYRKQKLPLAEEDTFPLKRAVVENSTSFPSR